MNTLEILIEARKLIEEPENWTQVYYALDGDGELVEPSHSNATCFCMLGAIAKATGDDAGLIEFTPAVQRLRFSVGGPIVPFNGTASHDEVLSAFDRAIEAARASEVKS
jgi:hypothetical protein